MKWSYTSIMSERERTRYTLEYYLILCTCADATKYKEGEFIHPHHHRQQRRRRHAGTLRGKLSNTHTQQRTKGDEKIVPLDFLRIPTTFKEKRPDAARRTYTGRKGITPLYSTRNLEKIFLKYLWVFTFF